MIEEKCRIELASLVDAREIALISREEIELGTGWRWTQNKVEHSINNPNVNVIVAKNEQTLLGFGIMKYDEETANLDLLAVKQDFRRKGVASKVIHWLEAVALNAGIKSISVQVIEFNINAQRLYSKLGFVPVSKVPNYYSGEFTAIIMAKELRIDSWI